MAGNGPELDAAQAGELVTYLFDAFIDMEKQGLPGKAPVCLWGNHGIGKTELIGEIARKKGWGFSYCAPAQFEELGDAHGLPYLAGGLGAGDRKDTKFAAPDWVPREEGPGIVLLDDINRSDGRILNGFMQLMQRYEMFSWRLPPLWQIAATANPERGGYNVVALDNAFRTRCHHLTLRFDARAWSIWATESGIDSRCRDFVLLFPELALGSSTSPRTLAQFFRLIGALPDFRAASDKIARIGRSCLDEETVDAFVAYIVDDMPRLVSAEDILCSADFPAVAKRIQELAFEDGIIRTDRMAMMATRVFLRLLEGKIDAAAIRCENLVSFLLMKGMPADLRLTFWRDVAALKGPEIKRLLQDPRLASAIMRS